MKKLRFNDFAPSAKNTSRTIDDRGYMTIKGSRVARTGTQYYYGLDFLDDDRIELEKELGRTIGKFDKIGFYRPPETVFSEDVLSAYDNVDVTINHPADKDVNAATHREKNVIGHAISCGKRSGDWMIIDLIIKDRVGIDAINSGMTGLSAGFDGIYAPEHGIDKDGNEFDLILTGIIPNHIAICDNARAGQLARLNDSFSKSPELKRMKIKLADGRSVEVSDENASIVQNEIDTAAQEAAKAKKAQAEAEAKADALKDENEELKAKTTDSAISGQLQTLLSVRDGAQLLTGKLTDSSQLDVNAIRASALDEAGVKCRCSDSGKWEDADPVSVEARFQAEVDRREEEAFNEESRSNRANETHKAFSADAAKAKTTDSATDAREAGYKAYVASLMNSDKESK